MFLIIPTKLFLIRLGYNRKKVASGQRLVNSKKRKREGIKVASGENKACFSEFITRRALKG